MLELHCVADLPQQIVHGLRQLDRGCFRILPHLQVLDLRHDCRKELLVKRIHNREKVVTSDVRRWVVREVHEHARAVG